MLNFCSLYSGSSGNSLFVESDNCKILVDTGVSGKKIVEGLASIDKNIEDIDGILITHEHIDHVRSLGTLSKKYNIPIYITEKTWSVLKNTYSQISENNINIFSTNDKFNIKDLEIKPFEIPHDAIDPCGFNIFNQNKKISIATDIGHINSKLFSFLENSSFMLLESNYDPEILKFSSYSPELKRRIDGPNGHLSNYLAGNTISKLIPSGLKNVMLGHLSNENNFPELAFETVSEEIKNLYDISCIELSVASRNCPSKLINIC